MINKTIIKFIDRGRVGYLLKQSRPVRNKIKVSKEYKPTFQILKMGSSERTSEHAEDNTRFEEEKHEDIDMNVDYRPESRYQNKAGSGFLQQFKRGKSKNKRDPIFIQVEDQLFNIICIMKFSFSKNSKPLFNSGIESLDQSFLS